MATSLAEAKRVLSGKRILLVEDDYDLANRLSEQLLEYGVQSVNIQHTVETGLAALIEPDTAYDLLITGMMMPATSRDYEELRKIRSQAEKCLDTLVGESDYEEETPSFRAARELQQKLHTKMYHLMDSEGGLKMVETFFSKSETTSRPPILFFSARENRVIVSKALAIAGEDNALWLSKPVTFDEIMLAIARLITKSRSPAPQLMSLESEFARQVALASADSLSQPVLEFFIDPGDASKKTIRAVLDALSDYHIAAGGLGLEYTIDGQYILARMEVRV